MYVNNMGTVLAKGKDNFKQENIYFLDKERDKDFVSKTSFFTLDSHYFTFHGVLLYKMKIDFNEKNEEDICTYCLEQFSYGLAKVETYSN